MGKKQEKLFAKYYKVFKSFFDILFAVIFLILGFPLCVVIALLIKFSSRGPIFFLQERIGKNRKSFQCIKFRTMHAEAEHILENLFENNNILKKEFEKLIN